MKRNKVADEIWEQAKIALASGSIGLRELARKMNIPPGTMLARASREGWTKKIEEAKRAARDEQSLAIKPTVMQSLAVTLQQRADRHVERDGKGSTSSRRNAAGRNPRRHSRD